MRAQDQFRKLRHLEAKRYRHLKLIMLKVIGKARQQDSARQEVNETQL